MRLGNENKSAFILHFARFSLYLQPDLTNPYEETDYYQNYAMCFAGCHAVHGVRREKAAEARRGSIPDDGGEQEGRDP